LVTADEFDLYVDDAGLKVADIFERAVQQVNVHPTAKAPRSLAENAVMVSGMACCGFLSA